MKQTEELTVTTPSDLEIRLERAFRAPRELVFDAFTRPELIKRWLTGPPGNTLPHCEIDLRVGGALRYVWRGPDGTDMGMGGLFREVDPPGRIVHTEIFDEFASMGGESVVTTLFEERDGKTVVTTTILYRSREIRDKMIEYGMSDGVSASYANLDELLARDD